MSDVDAWILQNTQHDNVTHVMHAIAVLFTEDGVFVGKVIEVLPIPTILVQVDSVMIQQLTLVCIFNPREFAIYISKV